jgi:hypothetical protein
MPMHQYVKRRSKRQLQWLYKSHATLSRPLHPIIKSSRFSIGFRKYHIRIQCVAIGITCIKEVDFALLNWRTYITMSMFPPRMHACSWCWTSHLNIMMLFLTSRKPFTRPIQVWGPPLYYDDSLCPPLFLTAMVSLVAPPSLSYPSSLVHTDELVGGKVLALPTWFP